MDTREAGRKGGLSKSAAKQASSRQNIAHARHTVQQALAAYKSAPQSPSEIVQPAEPKSAPIPQPEPAPAFRVHVPTGIAAPKPLHIFYGKPKE